VLSPFVIQGDRDRSGGTTVGREDGLETAVPVEYPRRACSSGIPGVSWATMYRRHLAIAATTAVGSCRLEPGSQTAMTHSFIERNTKGGKEILTRAVATT